MQLSVIIVNYNVRYFLEQCLLSVLKAGISSDMEVIVVDNNSTDGSRSFLEPKFPSVTFYWLGHNMGFGGACNYGATQASGSFLLFLNPDTIVPEDCFAKTLAFAQSRPDAGAIGVRMIDGTGQFLKESKRGLPSAQASFFKLSGIIKLFPQSSFFAQYYCGHLSEKEINPVDVLSGAFMLMSRTVFEKAGAFDEAFFMYGEDIDLSYRITKAGFTNYYFPDTTIIHFKGESTRKTDAKYLRNFYGAMSIFVKKHHPGARSVLLNAFVQLTLLAKRGVAIFKNAGMRDKETHQPPVDACGDPQGYERLKQLLGTVQEIKYSRAMEDRGNPMVLCEGPAFAFKAIIEYIDGDVNNINWFHAAGSSSMIASTSSKDNGSVITLPV